MSTEENRRRLVPVLAAAAAVLLVVAVVLAVFAAKWHGDASRAADRESAGKAALQAADKDLVDMTTYGYTTVDSDFDWLDRIDNAQLKKRLGSSVGDLKKVITASRATAKGEVLDSAYRVIGDGADQVEVLAFVDQTNKSSASQGLKVEQQRVTMTMKLVHGTWMISQFELLGGNNDS